MSSPSLEQPPAYENGVRDSPPGYGSSSSTSLPAQFSVYQKTGTSRPSTAVLTADEATPLHHISLGVGLLDPALPDVALHAGANEHSSIIATSNLAPAGSGHHIQLNRFSISEEMELSSRNLARKYSFRLDCENGGGGEKKRKPLQVFEWRPSRGEEVRGLGLRDHGWKLVCLGESDSSAGDDSHIDDEVVAAWSRYSDATSNKLLGFSFLGSGVEGTLGGRWETMAVITALAIWHTEIMN